MSETSKSRIGLGPATISDRELKKKKNENGEKKER